MFDWRLRNDFWFDLSRGSKIKTETCRPSVGKLSAYSHTADKRSTDFFELFFTIAVQVYVDAFHDKVSTAEVYMK